MGDVRDDLRLRRGALRHPKLVLLRRKHGAEAVLSLLALWDHAAGSRWDGRLDGMTDEEIEAAADWDGPPGAWISAVVSLRCLDGEPGRRSIHGWLEAQPWIAGREARIAAAKSSGKRGGTASAAARVALKNGNGTVKGTLKAFQPPSPSPSPSPSPTPPVVSDARAGSAAALEALTVDAVARLLKAVLGSSIGPCREQVVALVESGMDIDAIAVGVRTHGVAGMAPWDWTRAVQAGSRRADATKEDPACVECRTAPRAPGRALCTACLTPPDRAAAAGVGAEPVGPVTGAPALPHGPPRARARTPAVGSRGA